MPDDTCPFEPSLENCITRAREMSRETGTPHVVVTFPMSLCFGILTRLSWEAQFRDLGFGLKHTFVNGEEVSNDDHF